MGLGNGREDREEGGKAMPTTQGPSLLNKFSGHKAATAQGSQQLTGTAPLPPRLNSRSQRSAAAFWEAGPLPSCHASLFPATTDTGVWEGLTPRLPQPRLPGEYLSSHAVISCPLGAFTRFPQPSPALPLGCSRPPEVTVSHAFSSEGGRERGHCLPHAAAAAAAVRAK